MDGITPPPDDRILALLPVRISPGNLDGAIVELYADGDMMAADIRIPAPPQAP